MGSSDQELTKVISGRRGAGESVAWFSGLQEREEERRSWIETVPLYHPDTTTSGDAPHNEEGGPEQMPYTADDGVTAARTATGRCVRRSFRIECMARGVKEEVPNAA